MLYTAHKLTLSFNQKDDGVYFYDPLSGTSGTTNK